MFDKYKFKARVAEKGLSYCKLANLLGINQATLCRKINGSSEFTRTEIQILRSALELTAETAEVIFFADKLA